jgi:hypothetical protein
VRQRLGDQLSTAVVTQRKRDPIALDGSELLGRVGDGGDLEDHGRPPYILRPRNGGLGGARQDQGLEHDPTIDWIIGERQDLEHQTFGRDENAPVDRSVGLCSPLQRFGHLGQPEIPPGLGRGRAAGRKTIASAHGPNRSENARRVDRHGKFTGRDLFFTSGVG